VSRALNRRPTDADVPLDGVRLVNVNVPLDGVRLVAVPRDPLPGLRPSRPA
jgi:hypothetical protein